MKMTKKILSLVLVFMMIFSMSLVATSAYTGNGAFEIATAPKDTAKEDINGDVYGLIGDADKSDDINVRDATLIQKSAADLVVLDEVQKILADVNMDESINVKDATAIQKWVADIVTLEPVGQYIYAPGETPTEAPTTVAPTTAAPTTAAPTTAVPTTAAPTTAAPTTAAPTTAAPTTAAPTTAAPTTAAPTTAAPTTAAPTTAAPTTAAPTTAAPTTAAPTTAAPTTAAPTTAAPTTAAPTTAAPTTAAPTTAAPTTAAPTTAAPTTAAPTTAAPVEPTTYTVYFTNNENWENVYLYGFYGVEGEAAEREWPSKYPGEKMTFVRENSLGQDIYSMEIPADIDYIKFSDGTSANERTNNIPNAKFSDGIGFYLTEKVSGKWNYDTYTYTEEKPADPTTAAPTTAATTADEVEPTTAAPTVAPTTGPVVVKSNFLIRGSMNNWDDSGVMIVDGDSAYITYVLEADTYELKVYDTETDKWYGNSGTFTDTCEGWTMRDTEGSNLKFTVTGGTYKFTVKVIDGKVKLSVEKVAEVATTAAPTAAPTTAAPTTAAPTTAAPTTAAPTTAAPTTAAPTTAAPTTAAPTTAAPTTAAPTTAAPTTAAPVEPTTYTIYFTNNENWENVYLYGFYGVEGQAAEREWPSKYPGEKMTYVRENSLGQDIYSMEIPADIDYIKFSDGTSANERTNNIPNAKFSDGTGFYLTEKVSGKWNYDTYTYTEEKPADPTTTAAPTVAPTASATEKPTQAPTQAPTDPPVMPEYTVYFVNSAKWSKVNAYVWSPEAATWPGMAMVKTDVKAPNGAEVYSITLPDTYDNVVFNDGSSQTADLTFEAGKYYDFATDKWYASLEEVPNVQPTGYTVYCVNSKNWSKINAYVWNPSGAGWPGTAMTKTGEKAANGSDIYSITFSQKYGDIIFNDGSSQTPDLKFQAGQYYDLATGKWYASAADIK